MRKGFVWALGLAAVLSVVVWGADWPSTGGNPQRDGWAQGEKDLSKESIASKNVQLLYKYKFDGNAAKGLDDMSQPIVLNSIIGYKGFKQLVFVGGSSDVVYAFDADTSQPYFKTQLQLADKPSGGNVSAACSTGMTASLAMAGMSSTGRGFTPPPAPARGAAGAGAGGAARGGAAAGAAGAGAAGAQAGRGARGGGGGGGGGFGGRGGPAVLFALSSDGNIQTLRQQDGDAKMIPPAKFLPAGSEVSGLNVNANVIYAATVNGCGGNPNGLYAALYTPPQMPTMPGDPLVAPAKFDVVSFMTNGSGLSGSGGTVIGADGTVYGQVADGHGDVAGQYNDTVLAFDPKTLVVKDYFTPSGTATPTKNGVEGPGITPVYFNWNGQGLLVAGGRDGRLYILDATSLGSSDHHTPLYVSDPVVTPDSKFGGNGAWGHFATWTDTANGDTRWLYVAIRGSAAMKFPTANGSASTGSIVAFKVVDNGGKPSLSPQWISREMTSPAGPVTANGLVFALSTGLSPRVAKADGSPYTVAEEEKMAKPAVLYILDGASGQELLSSGNAATTFAHSGLAVANGKVYFTTHDNTMYAYGVPEVR